MPSLSPTSVSVMLQRSNRRYQSALLRATRETSRPNTMPTWARATSAVMRANPERSANPEPDTPKVFVNDDHLFFGPTQLAGFLDQSILASGGFAVVLDLRRARLANVDESRALDMAGLYFARIIHDFFPSPGRPERPA